MGFMRMALGEPVLVGGSEAVITRVVSADQVIVRVLTTGAVQPVAIRDLRPTPTAGPEPRCQTDLSLISDEDWAAAQMRYEAITPLLEAPRMDARVVKE